MFQTIPCFEICITVVTLLLPVRKELIGRKARRSKKRELSHFLVWKINMFGVLKVPDSWFSILAEWMLTISWKTQSGRVNLVLLCFESNNAIWWNISAQRRVKKKYDLLPYPPLWSTKKSKNQYQIDHLVGQSTTPPLPQDDSTCSLKDTVPKKQYGFFTNLGN